VRVEAVGCPKLDRWIGARPSNARPVIALAFHWRCQVGPGAGTAWDEFSGAIPELAERYEIIGHGHPRIMSEIGPWYTAHGIEAVTDQADVFRRADLLVGDATSCVFEFAATGRPVVILHGSDPARRDSECGGMYADRLMLGVVCYRPQDMGRCADMALADPPGIAETRRQTVRRCYANLGSATIAATQAIIASLKPDADEE
jgi:hypothetical protein